MSLVPEFAPEGRGTHARVDGCQVIVKGIQVSQKIEERCPEDSENSIITRIKAVHHEMTAKRLEELVPSLTCKTIKMLMSYKASTRLSQLTSKRPSYFYFRTPENPSLPYPAGVIYKGRGF